MTSPQKIIRLIRSEWPEVEISFAGSGHIRIGLPNGRKVYASTSPSDEYFFMRSVRSDIKRALRSDNND